ncbi:hypothetical protein LAZ67_2005919 [Cordylochernes scorpioides]|uniref:Transposase n=1 Tax=Cordylochernes scorpioides TaxID=51811 RepID=A0ABY6K4V6_9ARAC|nr:hypothetical protein LAZ67_2005919 [Cordylochernes scorpioides]
MPGHRKRRQFEQTDAFTRGMVIGLKRAGWSIRQIAADTHLGASTVHRLWRRWLEQGNVAIYRNVGATRVTSARVDRRILRQAVAAPQATCTAILQHVQDTLDHSISTRTISRRLVANGLHSCRPLRRLPLTPPNRRQGLEWCRARSTWMTEWHRVVFSDESRFCLSSDSRRVRVWRRRGERSNPAAIVERSTVRQRGIMGTITAQRYVDDVLRPVTLPYLQGVPNALYQQDNARPHTARISQQALQDVQMLPWPPYSPDLSPIEHVWDIIGRRLHALPQPCSEDELWKMVEREWRAIPRDAIHTLIDSLLRRVAACIAVRGKLWTAVIMRLQKRNGSPPSAKVRQPLPGPSHQTKASRDNTAPPQTRPRKIIEQIKVSRQFLDQCRSKAAAGTFDHMVYMDYSPEFTPVDYIKALENKLGKSCVVQLGKASGQVLVVLERPEMAETIIEDGLMVKGSLLKALPYQKKTEKITISGLPYVFEDADIIRTLRPYCQVVSIAPAVNSSGGYTWLDLKNTAFILINNGKNQILLRRLL